MKDISRQRIWEIWQAGKRSEELNEEDARLYEVMEHHMQHAALWDRLDTATDEDIEQGGVNLVLHILYHHVVENQLAKDNPPAVRQVMRMLMQKGLKEHDAAHAIASVIAWETYNMLNEKRVFDERRFVRELRKLPMQVKPKLKASRK